MRELVLGALALLAVSAWATAADGLEGPVVEMRDYEYVPFRVDARPGAVITLRNTGAEPHSFTSVDRTLFDETVQPGGSETVIAPEEFGEYRFYCLYHATADAEPGEGMAGVLTVAGEPAPPPTLDETPMAGVAAAVFAGALAAAAKGKPGERLRSGPKSLPLPGTSRL